MDAIFLHLISFKSYSRFEILDFLAFARTGMQFFKTLFPKHPIRWRRGIRSKMH